jgi:nucleoside-diphosphate-sugar epimerase
VNILITGAAGFVGKNLCASLQAVKDGKIPRGRHASYVRLAEELKNVNEWDKK